MENEELDKLDWGKIDIESFKYTLDQGEKLLTGTIESAKFQTGRVLTILKFVITLMIGLMAYLVANIPEFSLIYIESIITVILLIIILFKSLKAYKSFTVHPIGNNPANILEEKIVEYAKTNLYKYLLYDRCRFIEKAINYNDKINESRTKIVLKIELLIKIGLFIIFLFPLFWYLYKYVILGHLV